MARLAEDNPTEYENWTFSDPKTALAEHGIQPRKSDGIKVVRTDDLARALTARARRDTDRDRQGHREFSLPGPSPQLTAAVLPP